jgi:3-hydroxybutyryl-CoA dehydrogenase
VRDSLDDAVRDADVVIEAAPEDLPLKQELFERLDQLAPAGAMLATNTSVMSVGEIGARAKRRERVIGTHWWNPPYLIPLVEVVQAEATAEEVVRRMTDLSPGAPEAARGG